MSVNTSGTNQLPDRIQNEQTQQDNFNVSSIQCNANATITIKGQVIFDPPMPIQDASLIISPDASSQVQCVNGSLVQVLGDINMQGGAIQQLGLPTQGDQAVNLQYIQDNYQTATQTGQELSLAISGLDSVFMPIDETLDAINQPVASVDFNSQRLVNTSNPIDLQDAVNLQFLQSNYTDTTQSELNLDQAISALDAVFLPINSTLNDLQPQAGDYDTSGFQLLVDQPPTLATSLTNKQYVDSEIATLSTVYYPQTYNLNQIAAPTSNLDINGVRLTNIGINITATDAVRQDYLFGNFPDYTSLSTILLEYVKTGYIIANYYTQTYINDTFATIASLSSYITNTQLILALSDYLQTSTFNSTISNYVLTSYLVANYYTQTFITNTFVSISSLTSILLDYVTNSSLTTTLASYVTGSSLATTLASYVTSSSLASTLASYVTTAYLNAQNYITVAAIPSYTQQIQTNTVGVKSRVNCSSSQEILFNINDVQKLKMQTATGQATPALQLLADDKIQLISNLNAMSFTGQQAIDPAGQNYSGLYVKGLDNVLYNQGAQIQVGGSSNKSQALTMASGHINIGGIQTPYSAITNSADSIQQNLQVSAGTPQTDQTLTFYSNSFASLIGQSLTAQFLQKVGYATTTAITEANQFCSKVFVDSAISALSSIYLTIANFNTQIANYYLNTTRLDQITLAGNDVNVNNNYIQNCLDPVNPLDVANRQWVLTQASGITLTTAKENFYTLDGTNTVLPSANLELNSFQIKNLGDPILGTDALNLQTADLNYQSILTTLNNIPLAQGNISANNHKLTDLANGTNLQDAINLSQLNTVSSSVSNLSNSFKTAIITVGNTRIALSPTNVTSISGYVTSATKAAVVDQASWGQKIVVNYTDLGYVPHVQLSIFSSTFIPTTQTQFNQLPSSSIQSITSTQTIIYYGNTNNVNMADGYKLYLLFMPNTFV